jgi:HD domain
MAAEIEKYQDCLKDQAYQPHDPIRISLNPNISDPDLFLEIPQNPYIIDQSKLLQSKAIRRLSNKTQVFFDPDNPHTRTRLTHTHEMVAVGTTISSVLGLNTELVRAQTLGHDIGHAPAGHLFEQVTKSLGLPEFRHEHFSTIVASFIERGGDGLNLSRETLKGIYEHSRGSSSFQSNSDSLPESLVTMYSDKIAYITSDFNDLKRQNLISNIDIELINSLFPGIQRDKVNQCVLGLCQETFQKGRVSFFDSPVAKNFSRVKDVLYNYYAGLNRTSLAEKIKNAYGSLDQVHELEKYDKTILIALMTDKELFQLDNLSCNRRLRLDDLLNFGVFEILQLGFLEGQTYTDLDSRVSQLIYSDQKSS